MPVLAAIGREGPADEGFDDRFRRLDRRRWHVADYAYDHPAFANGWKAKLARPGVGGLRLALRPGPHRPWGAAVRRKTTTGPGVYAARLQAAAGAGVVTGFFLYTGPAHGTAHDEIDFEFLGADPRAVHLSWWRAGRLRQRRVALPFDATQGVHDYAITLASGRIGWVVDGEELFATTEQVPTLPMFLHLNLWAARPALAGWAGRYAGARAQARVLRAQFRPT